jgi:hypothetical protein
LSAGVFWAAASNAASTHARSGAASALSTARQPMPLATATTDPGATGLPTASRTEVAVDVEVDVTMTRLVATSEGGGEGAGRSSSQGMRVSSMSEGERGDGAGSDQQAGDGAHRFRLGAATPVRAHASPGAATQLLAPFIVGGGATGSGGAGDGSGSGSYSALLATPAVPSSLTAASSGSPPGAVSGPVHQPAPLAAELPWGPGAHTAGGAGADGGGADGDMVGVDAAAFEVSADPGDTGDGSAPPPIQALFLVDDGAWAPLVVGGGGGGVGELALVSPLECFPAAAPLVMSSAHMLVARAHLACDFSVRLLN